MLGLQAGPDKQGVMGLGARACRVWSAWAEARVSPCLRHNAALRLVLGRARPCLRHKSTAEDWVRVMVPCNAALRLVLGRASPCRQCVGGHVQALQ